MSAGDPAGGCAPAGDHGQAGPARWQRQAHLIGANGAGKTAAVECLQGLRKPDAGSMTVLGLDPQRDAQRVRSQIGSQLQDSGLPDRMRVSDSSCSHC
ncbi:ATP-binding cassette domain-containing protein [Nonomuraea wenchangensis]